MSNEDESEHWICGALDAMGQHGLAEQLRDPPGCCYIHEEPDGYCIAVWWDGDGGYEVVSGKQGEALHLYGWGAEGVPEALAELVAWQVGREQGMSERKVIWTVEGGGVAEFDAIYSSESADGVTVDVISDDAGGYHVVVAREGEDFLHTASYAIEDLPRLVAGIAEAEARRFEAELLGALASPQGAAMRQKYRGLAASINAKPKKPE